MSYPDWLFTRGITTIQVAPQTKAAGVFTEVTADIRDYFTVVDRINWGLEIQSADVRPLTQRQINMVPHSRGNSFVLQEILRASAPPGSPTPLHSTNSLADWFHKYEWFKVTFTRVGKTFTGYYSNGGYDEAYESFEKTTGVARFAPISQEATPADTFLSVANVTQT